MEEKIAKLRELLGLAEETPAEEVLQAAAEKIVGEEKKTEEVAEETEEAAVANKTLAAVRTQLGVDAGAGEDAILVALSQAKTNATAATRLADVEKELATIKDDAANRQAEALVDTYVTANKINPHDADHMTRCVAWAKRDAEDFKAFMAGQPAFVAAGRTTPPGGGNGSATASEDELIANSIKAHDGSTKDGMIALQQKLIGEKEGRGLSHKAAVAQCEAAYPKVFGTQA